MLVLTRKPGEQIVIANTIRITVVSVGHGRVKIGVEAPPNVSVDRQEVFARKQQEEKDYAIDASEPRPLIVDTNTPVLHNRIAERFSATQTNGTGPRVLNRRGSDPRKPR